MSSEIFTPYMEYQKEEKIKKLKSLPIVTNVEDKGKYLLVQLKSDLACTNSPIFRHSNNKFKCHEIKNFAKEIVKDENKIIQELRTLGPSFEYTFATLPKELQLSIEGKEYKLPLYRAIEIASKRSFDLIKAIKNVIATDREYVSEEERTNSLLEFLETMVAHEFYVKHPDYNKEKTFKKLYRAYDKKFVHFWIKKNGISSQQLLCDHDSTDQYSNDGHWYNSVGECFKCLIDTDRKDFWTTECDTAYTYWKAALRAYKVKKDIK
jgi:hypothetical protein